MTAKERYKEHSVKVKEYEAEFLKLVDSLDITELKKLRLETLFYCSRYTSDLKVKERINLVNEKKQQTC